MPLQNLFGDLSAESTQQELLANITYLLAAMLEKMPRVDTADRLQVTFAESNGVSINSGTVTTVQSVDALGGRSAAAMPGHASMAGAMHLYNNIVVSN